VRFSDFHAPPCADFHTFLSAIDFGAPLAHLARLPSFSNFKLACPLCPPRLHHASTAPAPRPRPTPAAPEFDRLKSLYCVFNITTYSTTPSQKQFICVAHAGPSAAALPPASNIVLIQAPLFQQRIPLLILVDWITTQAIFR
jgi:hypothetical protein